jgi:hypothetical protein
MEPKQLTKDEQIEQYKETVAKCKRLIKMMEQKSIEQVGTITKLKEKLNEYELGKKIVTKDNGEKLEVIFKFLYENNSFFFIKSKDGKYVK